jgi:hypothetical protein
MADKTKTGPVEEFVFEDWLRDGLEGVRSKIEKKTGGRFDTSGFRTHIRNARRERLLAVRSLIDSAIEFLDKQGEQVKT